MEGKKERSVLSLGEEKREDEGKEKRECAMHICKGMFDFHSLLEKVGCTPETGSHHCKGSRRNFIEGTLSLHATYLLGRCLTKQRQCVRIRIASALTDGHWSFTRRTLTIKAQKFSIHYQLP